jgi:hypothetical protein
MGNALNHQERGIRWDVRKTTLPDVNAFIEEIRLYNDKINRIRDALILAE